MLVVVKMEWTSKTVSKVIETRLKTHIPPEIFNKKDNGSFVIGLELLILGLCVCSYE